MALFEPVFGALNQAEARYVVVGGLAVVLHGHPRLTGDLDLVIDLDPETASRAMRALTDLGLRPHLPVEAAQFADPVVRERWIRERNLEVFSLHDPNNPLIEVDLFAREPLPFEELWERSELVRLENEHVPVASIPDLVRLKEAANREQDRADVEALRDLQRRRRDRD